MFQLQIIDIVNQDNTKKKKMKQLPYRGVNNGFPESETNVLNLHERRGEKHNRKGEAATSWTH